MAGYTDHVPVLETERLVLRAPGATEWPAYRDLMAGPRSRGLGGPYPAWRAFEMFGLEMAHWILRGFGMWAVVPKGSEASVGLVGLWFPEGWPEREVGWILWEGAEGRGYATEAARAARAHAYGPLGWDTAVSYIAPDNAASVRVAERLGAVRDATAARVDPKDLVYRHPAPGAG